MAYKIGEELFFKETGESAGYISSLYDFHGSTEYQLTKDDRCFDNTSRHNGAWLYFCNKEEMVAELERKIERIKESPTKEEWDSKQKLHQEMMGQFNIIAARNSFQEGVRRSQNEKT